RRFREIDPNNIYNSIAEGLITLDKDDNILTINRAAEQIFETTQQENVGKKFQTSLPVCRDTLNDYHQNGSPDNRYELTFCNTRQDTIYLRCRFSPLLDRHGEEIGTACLFTNLSTERLLEEKA